MNVVTSGERKRQHFIRWRQTGLPACLRLRVTLRGCGAGRKGPKRSGAEEREKKRGKKEQKMSHTISHVRWNSELPLRRRVRANKTNWAWSWCVRYLMLQTWRESVKINSLGTLVQLIITFAHTRLGHVYHLYEELNIFSYSYSLPLLQRHKSCDQLKGRITDLCAVEVL